MIYHKGLQLNTFLLLMMMTDILTILKNIFICIIIYIYI